MKGLILKDIMCLKKQLTIFVYVLTSVLIVSVMYVLSVRYGNLAVAGKEMMKDNSLSSVDVKNLGTLALVLFMLLPIATISDMANILIEDGKAGFAKVAGSLPVSLKKRLLSKYLTIYALLGIGALIDILMALLLSYLTDIIDFSDFFGIIISVLSVMSIYSALVILFCLIFGYGKEQYAQIISIAAMLLGLILIKWNVLKKILLNISKPDSKHSPLYWETLDFIKNKYWILFFTAALISVLSYGLSLIVAERKRGVI